MEEGSLCQGKQERIKHKQGHYSITNDKSLKWSIKTPNVIYYISGYDQINKSACWSKRYGWRSTSRDVIIWVLLLPSKQCMEFLSKSNIISISSFSLLESNVQKAHNDHVLRDINASMQLIVQVLIISRSRMWWRLAWIVLTGHWSDENIEANIYLSQQIPIVASSHKADSFSLWWYVF